jgi:two-component system osmolarity sensor histidine kinase EnvZ
MEFIRASLKNPKYHEIIKNFSVKTGIKFYYNKNNSSLKKIDDSTWKKSKTYDYTKPLIDPLNQFKSELKNYGIKSYKMFVDDNDELITIEIKEGNKTISFEIIKKRIASSRAYIFTLWMILTAFVTSLITIIFIKNQIRSLSKLTKAAEKFGRGHSDFEIRPSGSREIRSLTNSFIKMKERVMRQILQRTDMLSAVSHDLRTPLTRMKLQLEMMPKSTEIEELKSDITDMEKMIDEYLDFSRSEDKEKPNEIKIRKFLNDKIIKFYDKMNKKIEHDIEITNITKVTVRKIALKRALMNLIDNGFNYGNKVKLCAKIENDNLKITIDDNGPGIPDEEKENVLKPFYRVDNSRNLDKKIVSGGSGLGLAIAADGITSHGGYISLLDSEMGGLRVEINIPV